MRKASAFLALALIVPSTAAIANVGGDPMGYAASRYSACLDQFSRKLDDGKVSIQELVIIAGAACRKERIGLETSASWQSPDAQLLKREELHAHLVERRLESMAIIESLHDLQERRIAYFREAK